MKRIVRLTLSLSLGLMAAALVHTPALAQPCPEKNLNYWMMVSMAAHFFFSTICWWRADRSDSPPGGKACQ